MLASCISPAMRGGCGEANALSQSPGEYGRKAETQRNWRGGTQPVEHVVQFETNRRTSPGLDIPLHAPRKRGSLRGCGTGAAWLSSARSVRSALKWDNERNPRPVLYVSQGTGPTLCRTGRRGRRQVSMALMPWATHMLQ